MPKPLQHPPPVSAVTRFLNEDGVTRALKPSQTPPEVPRDPLPTQEARQRTVKREFVLTTASANSMDALVEAFRLLTGTRVSGSHALRAMLIAVERAIPLIHTEVAPGGPWRLPANGARFESSRADFEQRLGTVLLTALLRTRGT